MTLISSAVPVTQNLNLPLHVLFTYTWHGVRLLAWLSSGDQKVNTEVVEKSGLGLGTRSWGWIGERRGDCRENKEMMGNEDLKLKALEIREEARKAVDDGGNSKNAVIEVIEKWKNM
ncbi:hypothetical protein JCGZ_15678 [Jatropha curcas]|uniref:Uncharacterized protein n=1 Tax=Jatropha curcas TaxID=180498 RepID=A0A067KYK6_JATCU|nr:hypothetical protein JCGZ_15678 [Jatropha curcas]